MIETIFIIITGIISIPVILLILYLMLLFLLQFCADIKSMRHGGRIPIEELITRLNKRSYSIVSLRNCAGMPEVWVYPLDVGDQWLSECELHSYDLLAEKIELRDIKIFKETWSKTESWIIKFDDEMLDALGYGYGTLNVVEKKMVMMQYEKLILP